MTIKGVLYALAVVVLTGSMAVAALADDQGMNSYGPADSSVSSQPDQGMDQPNAGEIHEPMETGAVPDRSVDSSGLHSNTGGDGGTVEIGGQLYRPGIDFP